MIWWFDDLILDNGILWYMIYDMICYDMVWYNMIWYDYISNTGFSWVFYIYYSGDIILYIYCKWILYDDMTLIPVFHGFSISTILDIYYIANGYDMIWWYDDMTLILSFRYRMIYLLFGYDSKPQIVDIEDR